MNLFKSIAGFFHRHPGIKTTIVGGLGAAASAAASGAFGPKAAAIAAGVGAIAALHTKRPADATSEDKGEQPEPEQAPVSASGIVSLNLTERK